VEFAPLIETTGVVFGVAGVWLTIRQHVWCWPVGIVSVALFAVVFFEARLYASAALQLGYVAISLYGWYAWRHPREGQCELPVTQAPVRVLWALAAAAAMGTACLGLFLRDRTDAVWPLVDAGTTSFSLAAQFMTTRKWMETWIVWIAVDAIYVAMYLSQGLVQTTGLYAVFLVLAVLGYREWRSSMTRERQRFASVNVAGSSGESEGS
jgi:nicotinamide mononucleotide transporter